MVVFFGHSACPALRPDKDIKYVQRSLGIILFYEMMPIAICMSPFCNSNTQAPPKGGACVFNFFYLISILED